MAMTYVMTGKSIMLLNVISKTSEIIVDIRGRIGLLPDGAVTVPAEIADEAKTCLKQMTETQITIKEFCEQPMQAVCNVKVQVVDVSTSIILSFRPGPGIQIMKMPTNNSLQYSAIYQILAYIRISTK